MGDKIIKNVIDYIISFPSLDGKDRILFVVWYKSVSISC